MDTPEKIEFESKVAAEKIVLTTKI